MEFNNRVIIITGASMGIGEATARALARRGARLVLAARSRSKLESLARELPGSLVVEADMTNAADIKAMVDETQQHFGRIDALVNNAGRGLYAPVEHVDVRAYREILELNVVGPLLAMEQVIPRMRAQGGGAIVNISSMVSKAYIPGLAAYASTKYALNALTLTAREELAGDNIVVSAVYPGLTDTNFGVNAIREGGQRAGMSGGDSPELVAERIVYALESGDAEVYMR